MFVLDTEEQVYQRIKHPAKLSQLKRDYGKFGKDGKKIIEFIEYFDKAYKHNPNVRKSINNFYRFIKHITPDYCYSKEKIELLKNVGEEFKWIEAKFEDNSIIDEKPIFNPEEHNPNFEFINPNTTEEVLDEIVYWTRFYLSRPHFTEKELINFKLVNRCNEAAYYVCQLANVYGFKAQVIKIPPAFSEDIPLYRHNMEFHYFTLLEKDNKKYIVDCTYSQFFSWYRNSIERMGHYGSNGCLPGIYMLKSEARENVARTILKNGWIELNEDTIKHYMDGFALSYRNGLFYEELGEAKYETPYTIEDYHKFIFTNDSQLKREGAKVLGYQRYVMKKSDFKF